MTRGNAIINDVTFEEAEDAGFSEVCELISSGVNTPGFVYDRANKASQKLFDEADVIITNPTHFSVAVKYDSKEMDAPTIIAKGADLIALKIREIAKDHDVPIIENPPVARLLHKLDVGTTIPESLFKAVAEILAHVYSLKGNKL